MFKTQNVSNEVTEYEFSILARRLKRNKNFIVMTIGEIQTKETKVTVRIAGKGDLMDDGLLLEVDYDNNKAFFEEIKTKDHSIWITDSDNDISILARCWQDGCKGYSLCMFNKAMDFDEMLDSLMTSLKSLGTLEVLE